MKSAQEPVDLGGERLPLGGLTLLPPALGAGAVLCVGVNYAGHARSVAERNGTTFDPTRPPALFIKVWSSLTGSGQPIVRPKASEMFDFEGELVVVIGEHCHAVPRERALGVVAGYTIGMDGSIRDWQRMLPTPLAGKNFAGTGALGPWVVTADEVGDPAVLRVTTTVNGEVMQDAPVSDLIHDVPALIEHITTFMPLSPGDVIFTGTPQGCRADRGNDGWLQPGDVVTVSVPGIGELTNTVVDEDR